MELTSEEIHRQIFGPQEPKTFYDTCRYRLIWNPETNEYDKKLIFYSYIYVDKWGNASSGCGASCDPIYRNPDNGKLLESVTALRSTLNTFKPLSFNSTPTAPEEQ